MERSGIIGGIVAGTWPVVQADLATWISALAAMLGLWIAVGLIWAWVIILRHDRWTKAAAQREMARGTPPQQQTTRVVEGRFTMLADAAPVLMWTAEADGQRTFFNKAWLEFTGRESQQEQGWGWADAIHPEDRQQYLDAYGAAIQGHQRFHIECRLRRHDGEWRWMLDFVAPSFEDGELVGFVGSCFDITNRKAAEEALRDSETRVRSILATAVDGIIVIDEQGTIESLNPAAERLFQYSAAEVIGKNVKILMPSPYREEHDGYLKRYLETGLARIIGIGREVVGLRKDGTVFPFDLAVSEMRLGGRRMFTGLVHDVTERKRQEDELRQAKEAAEEAHRQAEEASRMKDEFLATLSHELRTPLNAILGWARLLREGQLDPETAAQALETIERNAQMQAQLIADLLDVSRITSGKLKLNIRPIELKSVIDAAVDSVLPAARAKEIELEEHTAEQPLTVRGDATRLQQVVWNLLSNATKFTARGGLVTVRTQRIGSQADIIVSDTGRGISPEFLPHMFERFRQADSSSTRQHTGLGLGLAIVRHLVEAHGGTVEAYSEGPGKGATLTVHLPLAAGGGQQPAPVHVEPSRLAAMECPPELDGVKALVVDDDADACRLLKTVLEQCRMQVRIAQSAGEAVEAVKQFRPDVLIADIAMPGEDGYALIRRVRKLPAEAGGRVPAVALTAFARSEDRRRALAAGFQMHVPKPAEPAELAAVVASLATRNGKPPA